MLIFAFLGICISPYDDSSFFTVAHNGSISIQDTAWPGYEQIPAWIMEGYTTLAGEIFDQLTEAGEEPPTHLFLQAGVGSSTR